MGYISMYDWKYQRYKDIQLGIEQADVLRNLLVNKQKKSRWMVLRNYEGLPDLIAQRVDLLLIRETFLLLKIFI